MKGKKWACPYCAQTSSRNWNLRIHIARHHGHGDPIRVDEEKSTFKKYQSSQSYTNKPSFHRKESKSGDFTGSVMLDDTLSTIRKLVEYRDLTQKLSPQPPVTTDDLIPWMALMSLHNSKTSQGRKSAEDNELPAGYRIRVCNNCLSGNRLEPVSASGIEFEALTKINHTCTISEVQKITDYSKNIREGQEMLLSALKQVITIRISQQGGGRANTFAPKRP